MTIGRWFLPERVNLRLTALFDHLREANRFDFQKFHCGWPGRAHPFDFAQGRLGRALPIKKSARELRQGGSDYRCCIPALAGFVSPQSIAPDGEQTFSQESRRATRNSEAFDEKSPDCARPRLNPLRAELLSAEWEIRLYARYIGTVHARPFAQSASALCIFCGQQMASRRVRSQNLAARRDFKTLRYCFTCFASRNWLRHKAPSIDEIIPAANASGCSVRCPQWTSHSPDELQCAETTHATALVGAFLYP